jgi:para-nitrobenzyl esterase
MVNGKKKRYFILTLKTEFLLVLLILSGFITCCSTKEEKAIFLEGRFIDSPVSGLNYKTKSVSGLTEEDGKFRYVKGEEVTFSIGQIIIGKVIGKKLISPLDLVPGVKDVTNPQVTNIAMLLQTLDHDGYLNNGIQIPYGIDSVITESINNYGEIDFKQNSDKFAGDKAVSGLLYSLNSVQKFAENTAGAIRQMVSVKKAQTHLQANFTQRIEANTTYGTISGYVQSDDTWVWLGIPYAKPPLGELRWRAPQSPESFTNILNATAHCMPCTQQIITNTWRQSYKYMGSEDCLYLDIYRPKTKAANLPVYVWFHGGLNNFGANRDVDGSTIARQGNMIVVVAQYRLGALGWFTHPSLRDTEDKLDASGNYGLLDQMKALKWVKKNITAFGGNSENITIGGQSGGAHDVLDLLISPAAKGLFQKAVIQSAILEKRSIDDADKQSSEMIDWMLEDDESATNKETAILFKAHMDDDEMKSYLRSKAAVKILESCRLEIGNGFNPPQASISDGTVLPKSNYIDTLTSGAYTEVPVLIGSNEYEYKNFMPLIGQLIKNNLSIVPSGNYAWNSLYLVLDKKLKLNAVFPTQRDKDFYQTVNQLKSRFWKALFVDSLASAIKKNKNSPPVYAYRFDWSGGGDSYLADFDFIFGAAHGMQNAFFFGNPEDDLKFSFTSTNRIGRIALQEAMMDYLANFISKGDPNPPNSSLLEWPQWSNIEGDPKFIILDASLEGLQLSVSSQDELLSAIYADVAAARAKFNSETELEYLDYFGLSLPKP